MDGCTDAIKENENTTGEYRPLQGAVSRHRPKPNVPSSHSIHSPPLLSPPSCQRVSVLSSVPLEDDGAADEDAHQQDHGPDSRKGSGLRGGRGLALGQARRDDQRCNNVLWGRGEEDRGSLSRWTKTGEGATCMHSSFLRYVWVGGLPAFPACFAYPPTTRLRGRASGPCPTCSQVPRSHSL